MVIIDIVLGCLGWFLVVGWASVIVVLCSFGLCCVVLLGCWDGQCHWSFSGGVLRWSVVGPLRLLCCVVVMLGVIWDGQCHRSKGCFGMVGPLQESAEAGCALQRWTRSAAAVTIAVDLGSWLADVKTRLHLTADRAHSFISETNCLLT